MATWRGPPTRVGRLIRRSLSKENSIPIAKRRSTTPTSARTSICSTSWTSRRPWGPATTPVAKNPTTTGIRSLWPAKMAIIEMRKMTMMSLRS